MASRSSPAPSPCCRGGHHRHPHRHPQRYQRHQRHACVRGRQPSAGRQHPGDASHRRQCTRCALAGTGRRVSRRVRCSAAGTGGSQGWRSNEWGVVWEVEDLARAAGGRVLRDGVPGPVWTDTRSLPEGAWFLALQGDNFDGHDYLHMADARDCAGVVVSQPPPDGWSQGVVLVEDTLIALQSLGADVRTRFSGQVVAITGSCGKTTVKEMVKVALSERFDVHATRGNLNNGIGVPLTLLSAPPTTDVMVLELGMSAPGEIELLASICQPHVRVITCVAEAHLAGVGGTLEGIAQAKAELVSAARPGDTVILNADDPYVISMQVPERVQRMSFGSEPEATVRVRDCLCHLNKEGPVTSARTTFTLSTQGEGVEKVTMSCFGKHLSGAAAAATAVGLGFGLPLSDIARSLSRFEGIAMRMEVTAAGGLTFINDAYNANPASMAIAIELMATLEGTSAVLDYESLPSLLSGLQPGSKRVVLLGDMLEQGPNEAAAHRNVLKLCGVPGIDLVGVAGDAFSQAAASVQELEWRLVTAAGPVELAERVTELIGEEDVILVKGSRGMKMEAVITAIAANKMKIYE